jgi:hypothetical protein
MMKMKQCCLLTLLCTLLLGSSPTAFAQNDSEKTSSPAEEVVRSFADIQDHWAKEAVTRAVRTGYVTGYPDQTFKPEASITRAEFLAMLLSSTGAASGNNSVEPWYAGYTKLALELGIYEEPEYTNDHWSAELTRAEMAKFVIRYLNSFLEQPSIGADGDISSLLFDNSFWNHVPDEKVYAQLIHDSVVTRGDFAELAQFEAAMTNRKLLGAGYRYEYPNTRFNNDGYMYLAASLGIVSGYSDGRVHGEGTTTRAQAITIIERFLDLKNGRALPPADKAAVEDAEFEWHRTNLYSVMGKHLDLHIRGDYYYGLNHDQLRLATSDRIYSAELKRLVVIDLEDSASVEKYQVDLENWKWRGGSYYALKDSPKSYLFLWESDVSGEGNTLYGSFGYMPLTITVRPEDEELTQEQLSEKQRADAVDFNNGILNRGTSVVDARYEENSADYRLPAFILPKASLSGDLTIRTYTPKLLNNNGEYREKSLMIMKLHKAAE